MTIVLIEAIFFGIPLVSIDCPFGHSEVLLNGEYGLLVPTGDPGALAFGMQKY